MSAPGASQVDIAIVGAGAAGLMAAIWAGRSRSLPAGKGPSIIALDGAAKLGAKILVAGGGRCNVTHHAVDELQYAGSSRNAIRNVLRRFDVPQVVSFFKDLGVDLKREDTGKLFPTTDDARTVLDALLRATKDAGVRVANPWRVESVTRDADSFLLARSDSPDLIRASRVILATGGRSLPKTGSDGHGHAIAKSLGHSITPYVFPALVPLTLPKGHVLTQMLGITLDTTLELRSHTGKRLKQFTNSTLLTHFGLSGPGPLDMSRYYTSALRGVDAESGQPLPEPPPDLARASLVMNFLPGETLERVDAALQGLGQQTVLKWITSRPGTHPPERLARALCEHAAQFGPPVDPNTPGSRLTRDQRRALARVLTEFPLPITGDRGYLFAEVTAGGVPLSEIHLATMESRVCPGLHLCGEILDVDGRIGGFNFQWAWASGYVAGFSAAKASE